MKFKGILIEPFYGFGNSLGDPLEFTKNQIVFPKSLEGFSFEDSNIKHGTFYTLMVSNNIDANMRYEIRLNNGKTIRLLVDNKNEKKLKRIHGLDFYGKYPIRYDIFKAIITGIVSILVSLLLILLNCQRQSRLYEQQEKRLDSLSVKVDSLKNALHQ
jgi:hypothetical protein